MSEPLDNELTPLAEGLWRLYTQLVRAGFERLDALEISIRIYSELFSASLKK